MQLLDFLFGMEACVYTSLMFKYGTQQPVHRDTPHFATWPRGYFFGVWTALEDIDPESGPIFYHRGAHRYAVDEHRFWNEARSRIRDAPEAERLLLALDLYYGEIIHRSPVEGPVVIPELKIGDVVIWHPELPHVAAQPRTRNALDGASFFTVHRLPFRFTSTPISLSMSATSRHHRDTATRR